LFGVESDVVDDEEAICGERMPERIGRQLNRGERRRER
jgi:hypothetical protein